MSIFRSSTLRAPTYSEIEPGMSAEISSKVLDLIVGHEQIAGSRIGGPARGLRNTSRSGFSEVAY